MGARREGDTRSNKERGHYQRAQMVSFRNSTGEIIDRLAAEAGISRAAVIRACFWAGLRTIVPDAPAEMHEREHVKLLKIDAGTFRSGGDG